MSTQTIQLQGFENQTIEVQLPGLLSTRKLLVNGEPAPKGEKRGEMRLTQDDGREVIARWKRSFGSQVLEVEEQTYQVSHAFKWYEWIMIAIPLILAAVGFMGWVYAALAVGIGYTVFQSRRPLFQKTLLWVGGLVLAIGLNMVIGGVLLALLR